MAMKRCPVCGERYSDTYKECPFCEEEEYWEEEQEPASRPVLREGGRATARTGRSTYSIVTPILIVLIVLMALLLVYLLYGDKFLGKDKPKEPDDSGKTDITTPVDPGASTPAVDPNGADLPGTGAPSDTDTPEGPEDGTSMPEGGGDTTPGDSGSSGGMSYATAAALPGGLTLSRTDFSRSVSEGGWQLKVSGGTGTYTWISENPSIATVSSDGTVTPVASGTTHVVVTDGSKRAICIVRVTGGGSTPSSGGTTTTPPSTPSSGGTTTTTPPSTPSTGGGSLRAGKAVVVNGGNGVRVRSGPGTNYDILATVPNGGSVQIVQSAGTGDWYEITFSNVGGVTTTGYMKGEFLANS
ncbi:SH3 domain-containing protein [uncultured Oscillibacter sp.]|uniref:SH3 domain-containing protein n=1 Tax=uncultured Oscillibacter sp. TaxID=876091 RepID=UPI002634F2B2|nr:SH3 domain-containing protein [uncultured Oscillibacter sp.]